MPQEEPDVPSAEADAEEEKDDEGPVRDQGGQGRASSAGVSIEMQGRANRV